MGLCVLYYVEYSSYNVKKVGFVYLGWNYTLRFMCTALPLDEIYPPTQFHNHSKYSFGDMHQTKFKYESKQRAITQKISKQELQFMCTALPLDEIYPPTKFHNHSRYSFGDMHQTKFKYENKQRAKKTSKI